MSRRKSDDEEEGEESQEIVPTKSNGVDDSKEENFSPKVMKRIDALEKLHDSIGEIDKEYKKERALLEEKYLGLRRVIYEQRKQIITGEVEVPEAEAEIAKSDEENIKGIPGFWFRALANHEAIGDFITEEDIPALEALTNITVSYNESYSSFKLVFHFAENPYFSNQTLEKSYELTPDILEEKSPTLSGSAGTVIQWKPSKDLTVTEIKKKQKAKSGKNKGQVRTVTRLEPKASFFHYFSDPVEDPEADAEDEENPNVRIGIEEDYDIGHSIRTDIIPDAIKWFTGEAVPDDIEYGEEDGEDDEAEDEEEGDDDDDDDDDDDVKKKSSRTKATAALAPAKKPAGGFAGGPGGSSSSGAGGGSPSGEQPECKQN